MIFSSIFKIFSLVGSYYERILSHLKHSRFVFYQHLNNKKLLVFYKYYNFANFAGLNYPYVIEHFATKLGNFAMLFRDVVKDFVGLEWIKI